MALADLRTDADANGMTARRGGTLSGLLKRTLTAVVFVPLFVWMVAGMPGWLFAALVSAAAAITLWELYRLFEQAGHVVYRRLGLVLGVALVVAFEVAGGTADVVPTLPAFVLTVAAVVILAAPVASGGRPAVEPPALTLLGILYVAWSLGHALLLHRLREGDALVLLLVGVTWVGETAAYGVGSTLGRRRLAPVISPRKTVEGAVAQLVASVLVAVALGAWLLPGWGVGRAAGAGALLGVVGQVGDLAESAIKRSAGVKDAGGLIPGHGGLLDRMDSLLFNVPALYYYYAALGGAA